MNARHLIAIIAFSAAGTSAAESTYPWVDFTGYEGTRTRAEVRAELYADGAQHRPEFSDPVRITSGKSRDEVRAELERSHVEGRHVSSRMPEFIEFGQVASVRSRDEVRAEAVAARNAQRREANGGS